MRYLRIIPLILCAALISGCSSTNSGQWYTGSHKSEAIGSFDRHAKCTAKTPINVANLRLTELVQNIEYPGYFTDPTGVDVYGYTQIFGGGVYRCESINHAPTRDHERLHVFNGEKGVYGHPQEQKKCTFLWRERVGNALWFGQPFGPSGEEEITDENLHPIYDGNWNRIN